MNSIDDFIDKVFSFVGNLIGKGVAGGLTALGDKAGDTLISTDRPQDIRHTARRLKGEQAELHTLHTQLMRYADQAEDMCHTLSVRVVDTVAARLPDFDESPLVKDAYQLCRKLLVFERYYPLVDIDFSQQYSMGEIWTLTKYVRDQIAFYRTKDRQEAVEEFLRTCLETLVKDVHIPLHTSHDECMLSVSLEHFHRRLPTALDGVLVYLLNHPMNETLFKRLFDTLGRNLCIASGVDPEFRTETSKPPILPSENSKYQDVLVDAYLAQTPFADFLQTAVPFSIPEDARFEHMHIVGGSGHGKTQLLQHFLLGDLAKVKAGQCSVIVIDSQGDMINKIRNLATIADFAERVVIIDPTDIDYPPALNLFDFGLDRVERYGALERETLINGAVSLFEYVFGALLGAELTQKQGVIFRYLSHLLMQVPQANIKTLIQFMEHPDTTRPYLSTLEGSTAQFFETQFFSNKFNDTREQILNRLYGVLSTRVLDRMFSNSQSKLNLFDAMNAGSLILINTAKSLLKQEGCEILGRFFIALICQAAQERASIRENERLSTFVYIDEAHDYFDESMENLLNQARKYKVGLTLAHQNLHQFDTTLRATVMASTSIKLVGGLSASDANAFANEMQCESEFLQSLQKQRTSTEFACRVRNHTPKPIRLSVQFGQLERQPQLTTEAAAALTACNRARYCESLMNLSNPKAQDVRNAEALVASLGKPELL